MSLVITRKPGQSVIVNGGLRIAVEKKGRRIRLHFSEDGPGINYRVVRSEIADRPGGGSHQIGAEVVSPALDVDLPADVA